MVQSIVGPIPGVTAGDSFKKPADDNLPDPTPSSEALIYDIARRCAQLAIELGGRDYALNGILKAAALVVEELREQPHPHDADVPQS